MVAAPANLAREQPIRVRLDAWAAILPLEVIHELAELLLSLLAHRLNQRCRGPWNDQSWIVIRALHQVSHVVSLRSDVSQT